MFSLLPLEMLCLMLRVLLAAFFDRLLQLTTRLKARRHRACQHLLFTSLRVGVVFLFTSPNLKASKARDGHVFAFSHLVSNGVQHAVYNSADIAVGKVGLFRNYVNELRFGPDISPFTLFDSSASPKAADSCFP